MFWQIARVIVASRVSVGTIIISGREKAFEPRHPLDGYNSTSDTRSLWLPRLLYSRAIKFHILTLVA